MLPANVTKTIPSAPVLPVHNGRGKIFATAEQIERETKVLAMSLLNSYSEHEKSQIF